MWFSARQPRRKRSDRSTNLQTYATTMRGPVVKVMTRAKGMIPTTVMEAATAKGIRTNSVARRNRAQPASLTCVGALHQCMLKTIAPVLTPRGVPDTRWHACADSRGRELLAIEHPCYVVNADRGVRMLGGTQAIARARHPTVRAWSAHGPKIPSPILCLGSAWTHQGCS